jgi:hypothetical protein
MSRNPKGLLLFLLLFILLIVSYFLLKRGNYSHTNQHEEVDEPIVKKALASAIQNNPNTPGVLDVSSLAEKIHAVSPLVASTNKQEENASKFPDKVIRMLTAEDILKYEEVFAAAAPISDNGQSAPQIESCLIAFAERTGIDPWAYDMKQHLWRVALSVAANGKESTIEEASLLSGDSWPSIYDEEMKRCYLNSFIGITFEADETENYRIQFVGRHFAYDPKVDKVIKDPPAEK